MGGSDGDGGDVGGVDGRDDGDVDSGVLGGEYDANDEDGDGSDDDPRENAPFFGFLIPFHDVALLRFIEVLSWGRMRWKMSEQPKAV